MAWTSCTRHSGTLRSAAESSGTRHSGGHPTTPSRIGGGASDPYRLQSINAAGPNMFTQFSASCYYFGESLTDELAQAGGTPPPIGLIHTAWGGSIIEGWLPDTAIATCHGTDTSREADHSVLYDSAVRCAVVGHNHRLELSLLLFLVNSFDSSSPCVLVFEHMSRIAEAAAHAAPAKAHMHDCTRQGRQCGIQEASVMTQPTTRRTSRSAVSLHR